MTGTVRDLALSLPAEVVEHRRVELPSAELVTSGDFAAWRRYRGPSDAGWWVGSSEVAAVLGEDPDRSALEVYAAKLGIDDADTAEALDRDAAGIDGSQQFLRWGLLQEPAIALGYHMQTGARIIDQGRYSLYRRRDDPSFACTPDYFAEHRDIGLAVLECKNVGEHRADRWREGPPTRVLIQVQHQLWTLDQKVGAVACLLGGNRLWHAKVERDEAFCDAMVAAVHEFLKRLRDRDPPAAVGRDRELRAVSRLWPRAKEGSVVQLPDSAAQHMTRWLRAKGIEKAAEKRRKAAEAHLRIAIGDAEVGKLSDGRALSLRETERAATRVVPAPELEPIRYRVLRQEKE